MASTDRRSDGELVRVCNRGARDEAARAFEALYLRHRDFVLRVARRFTRDRELALDALQETFAYLLKKFPPEGPGLTLTARLSTLLYPVAKHCVLSALRKAREERASDAMLEEIAAEEPAPAEPLDAALAGLSSERREVVTLRFVDELTLAEIAVALEIPEGTVKSRLHLALKQLREDPKIKDLFLP
jgi:RNA polymerase sigma-70 factor, ECF subfamily